MIRKVFLCLGFLAALGFSQAWLDPANFPNWNSCNATQGMLDTFNNYTNGNYAYKVYTTPINLGTGKYESPVIDGTLEDSIWKYADTLVMNSWEDAFLNAACTDPRSFNGPSDLHCIWRFMYDDKGLYVGAEIHDDVFNSNNAGAFWGGDGIQLCGDPWDWGEKAGNWANGNYRVYYDNHGAVINYPNFSSTAAFNIAKNSSETEPYVAGLIHGVFKAFLNKSEINKNWGVGDAGIRFAAKKQGPDQPWLRTVWHMEFMFPWPKAVDGSLSVNNTIFDALARPENAAFWGTGGLPNQGNYFKMDFYNNDNDIRNGKSLDRHRENSDFNKIANYNWSNTQYYMVMQYAGDFDPRNSPGVPVITSAERTGDPRLEGSYWVDATTKTGDYLFTGGVFKPVNVYYDSTSADSGKISSTDDTRIGGYRYIKGATWLLDTVKISYTIGGTPTSLVLIPQIIYGGMEGRWVQAHQVISAPSARCGEYDTTWVPNTGAKEFRFCPLSKLRIADTATYPGYARSRCMDSLRIYQYGTDVIQSEFIYIPGMVLVGGRDSVYCTYGVDDRAIPKRLYVTYTATAETDTFTAWDPYPMRTFGRVDSTYTLNSTFVMRSMYPYGANQLIYRIRPMNKYTNYTRVYPDSASLANNFAVMIYPDLMMNLDTASTNYWSRMYPLSISVDSLQVTGYNPDDGTFTGTQAKEDTAVFPDSAWVQQICKVMVQYSSMLADTFLFKDISRVTWNTDTGTALRVNQVRPWCIGIEENAAPGVTAMSVGNYPNPFNPTTTLRFAIPPQKGEQFFALTIYNIRGQLVRTLVKGKVGNQGFQKKVVWEGMDNAGRTVCSGVYFYRLTVGSKVMKGTLVMVK